MKGYPKRRRRKHLAPIPFVISFELAFIKEDLPEQEYEQEVRRIVKEKLPTCRVPEQSGLWEEFDPFVSEIIREELACT